MSFNPNAAATTNKVDWAAFAFPAVLSVVIVSFGLFMPQQFTVAVNALHSFVSTYFGWFYALGSTALVFFCLWAALSKYGDIRLGGQDAKPEFSNAAWFAITFTTGMGMGIVFYSVGEPMMNFMNPPGFTSLEGGTWQAAEEALKYVLFHWGFHPYAIYTSIGLGFALAYWNSKRKYNVSSALYPLIGDQVDGLLGRIINGLSIAAIIGGVGTSCGLGILQISTGLKYAFGIDLPLTVFQVLVVSLIAFIYIFAACSGIHKGIKHVSTVNMYVFIALMVWAFIFLINNYHKPSFML